MRGSAQKIVGFSFYGDINTPKNKKKGIYLMSWHFEILTQTIIIFVHIIFTSLFSTPHVCFLGYFEGIVGNLELMPIYYPGWVMRLYYDLDDNDPITEVI